jgi:hypothetical protein
VDAGAAVVVVDACRSSSPWVAEVSVAVDAEDGAVAALVVVADSAAAAVVSEDSVVVVGSAVAAGDRVGESTMRKG